MSVAVAAERQSFMESLPGPARAAVLLLAMGQTGASRLLKHLTPEELRALRRGAADQRPVSALELDVLVTEFQDAFKAGPGVFGLDREMNSLLKGSLTSEELTLVFEEDPAPEPEASVWDQLKALGPDELGTLLEQEHPQTVALVLARLDAEAAASVVAAFEGQRRNEILRRMLSVRPLEGEVERLVEASLREAFLADPERAGRSERHEKLAEIVNRMEKSHADEMLASIAETAPEDASAIRRLLFAFEDVSALTKKARLVLFDEVSVDIVTTALVGAGEDLREAVLSSLAARSRRMAEAELSSGRDIDERQIAGARRQIAALALKLARDGRIALPAAD